MTQAKIFFILSCARSGSTSLAHILDTATNARCLSEPVPNLNIETREMMEGRLSHPRKVLVELVFPRIADVLAEGLIYGEKNLTLGPFVPYLHEMLRCKFVFLKRDGREVVTSLLNWHIEIFGDIYHECNEATPLSKIARTALAKLPVEKDDSDYSRPRPLPGDPFYQEWTKLSRFEMAAWYWQFINKLYIQNLSQIPKEDWIELNYTQIQASDIKQVFDFLGLEGFDQTKVEDMLTRRINSVWDRIRIKPRFPSWQAWDENRTHCFNRISSETMKLLGYYE